MHDTCAMMTFGRHLSEFTKWPYISTGINLYWPWIPHSSLHAYYGTSVMHIIHIRSCVFQREKAV